MPELRLISADLDKYIHFDGTPLVCDVLSGLEENSFHIDHPCGKNGICGKCRIDISGQISPPDEREAEIGYRLSCRTRLLGDAVIRLSKESNSVDSNNSDNDNNSYCSLPDNCGLAIDIGTTNIVISICDLKNKCEVKRISSRNPQSAISADVMGRIGAAINGKLSELSDSVRNRIGEMLKDAGINTDKNTQCVITGNTAMMYIFCRMDTTALSAAPFEPDFLFGSKTDAVWEGTALEVYIPKCIGAFVGADLNCAILKSGMCMEGRTSLLTDIGTNAEIALWKNNRLIVTSAAAGPAFEGSKMTGSEVIDILAALLKSGRMDYTGLLNEEETADNFENPASKISRLTQKEIRDLQLAKGAVMGGIKTLLEITETSAEDIDSFYIAGAFGSGMNIDNAVSIGLFPDEFKDNAHVLGNAALEGARMMLFDTKFRDTSAHTASEAEAINLGGNPKFNANFLESLNFPKQ